MPRSNNSHYLQAAAKQRHEAAVLRVEQALRAASRDSAPVSFRSIAAAAGVSKSWLYTQPELRAPIEQLRSLTTRSNNSVPVAARDRATEASLVRRIESLTDSNKALTGQNKDLREQLRCREHELATLHGQLREAQHRRLRPDASTRP